MKVRATAVTQPLDAEFGRNPSELMAHHARVSSTANQSNHETGAKLLARCAAKKEWSPFEMVDVTFEVTTTRDVSHQLIRHWSVRFQEFSQRYAAVPQEPVFREARIQDETNRQSSLPCKEENLSAWWWTQQQKVAQLAAQVYTTALAFGVAKEVARVVLPEGMTPTTLYAKASLRTWLHYCQLRGAPETQLEHRLVAQEIANILIILFPELTAALAQTTKST